MFSVHLKNGYNYVKEKYNKIDKKSKRALSLFVATMVATTTIFASISFEASASYLSASKYIRQGKLTNISNEEIKDTYYNVSSKLLYILKTDGSVITIPKDISENLINNVVTELYKPGEVREFVQFHDNSNGLAIIKSNGIVETLGSSTTNIFDFDKTKPINKIEPIITSPRERVTAIAIYYADGSVNVRGTVYYSAADVTVEDVKSVYASTNTSTVYFLQNSGKVRAFGKTADGMLGDVTSFGSGKEGSVFKYTTELPVSDVVNVYPSLSNTYLELSDNSLVGLGNSTNGQLGNSLSTNSVPVDMNLDMTTVKEIQTYEKGIVALLNSKEVIGRGDSTYGQLGNLLSTNTSWVTLPVSNVDVLKVTTYNTLFLSGTIMKGLGSNSGSALGVGAPSKSYIPVTLSGYYSTIYDSNGSLNTANMFTFRSYGNTYTLTNVKARIEYGATSGFILLNDVGVYSVNMNEENGLSKAVYQIYKFDSNQIPSKIVEDNSYSNFSYISTTNNYINYSYIDKTIDVVNVTQSLKELSYSEAIGLVEMVEYSLKMEDYKNALKAVEAIPISKTSFRNELIDRLDKVYDKFGPELESNISKLISNAEISKTKEDFDVATLALKDLPDSSLLKTEFIKRLEAIVISDEPEVPTEPSIPVDPEEPGDGDVTVPVDPEEPGDSGDEEVDTPVVTPGEDGDDVEKPSTDTEVNPVDYTKTNIINILNSISDQIDSSPNSTQLSQMKLSLSVVSGEVALLKSDDLDKENLKSQSDSLLSKLEEVSSYYNSSYSNASSLVVSAEGSKDRNTTIKAYKAVKRLPLGIERDRLLDRLDSIELN